MRKQKPSREFRIGKLKLNSADLLGERTKPKKPPKLTSAFSVKDVQDFLSQFPIEQLHQIYFQARQNNYWWMGDPTLERLDSIRLQIPSFDEIFNFQVLVERLKILDKFPRSTFGVSLSVFFPELVSLCTTARSAIESLPTPSLEKAESWLKSVVVDLSHDPDLEAAIYLASRGFGHLVDSTEIRDNWYAAICHSIKSGRPVGPISKEIQKHAESRQLSLKQAAEVLKFNDHVPSFWGFRDEEEDFVAATMLRAADWFSIGGFDEWWKSVASDFSTGPQYGIEHAAAGRAMFYWCRSDLALRIVERQGIEAWLWALSNGAHVREQPWRIFYASQKNPRLRDYLSIAACSGFAWKRIQPLSFKDDVPKAGINLLMQTQLRSGAWPTYADESEACLLTTCYAVHAIALWRPHGWARTLRTAAEWLWSQQNKFGNWSIQGGPTVMLTVLALDAIALAEGKATTFSEAKGVDSPVEISDQADHKLSKAICVLEGATNQGTGFFLKNVGLVTCNHVAADGLEVFTSSEPRKRSPTRISAKDSQIDLAILNTHFQPKSWLEANFREPKIGERVYLCGFPKYSPGCTLVKVEAQITGSRLHFGQRRYLLDKAIVVGNSGGPVLDVSGKVIGIAATGTDDRSNGNPDDQFGVIPVMQLKTLMGSKPRRK